MNHSRKKQYLLKFLYVVAITVFYSCANKTATVTKKPILDEYTIGEKWTWDWKRSVDGEIRAQGKDYQEVVEYKNTLGFYNGNDTLKTAIFMDSEPSETPLFDWPLEVGKKWKYEVKWENNEGTKGKTSQDAEIVSFNEETVSGGKFMAYKIEYKGRITNSRGFDGKLEDVFWYAPEIKSYIKHTQDDGEGLYVNELIKYSNPKKN
ncbi:hypothetical protein [Maribacter polysiphoniae]|uniref:hypothetical protein n=1 Tax=Maribacter polysiphoniae TaxID=429344 RepID=UPI0023530222|nr:hypothetical protein [Maribacter polysiphoniae]